MSDYEDFLRSKRHSRIDNGIIPKIDSVSMFDYQQFVADKAMRRGRCGVFLDTGLGKTLIELVVASEHLKHTNKRVLIITPLAVAFQFIKEAEKFGINDVSYSKDGQLKSKIVICNYERLDKFNPPDFDCVILDESSILKNFKGSIKAQITGFMKNVRYRYLFTATPSPNDYIELGTSSEALGEMGYMDMLTKFFTNNEDSISPNKIGVKWVLKGHATTAFFNWVSSWSISMRKPSDLGFSDDRHIMPELVTRNHLIHNDAPLIINGQGSLFAIPSTRLTEVRQEQKQTIGKRCEKAAELSTDDFCVYWCNLNEEGDTLALIDKDAVQIKGGMPIEKKEEILLAFYNGEIKHLITKPKITCFGLNWQHCNHTIYFPTFSYEQYYQSIRRFWRFGQQRPVTVDLVFSDGQEKVIQSLIAKSDKASELFSKLNDSINAEYTDHKKDFNQSVIIPTFLKRA